LGLPKVTILCYIVCQTLFYISCSQYKTLRHNSSLAHEDTTMCRRIMSGSEVLWLLSCQHICYSVQVQPGLMTCSCSCPWLLAENILITGTFRKLVSATLSVTLWSLGNIAELWGVIFHRSSFVQCCTVLTSGCTELSAEEGSAIHEGESYVSSLVDGQQTVWFDVPELG